MDYQKNLNHWSLWAGQPCVGLFGSVETQQFFITNNFLFCRLSSRLHTGSVHGLSFNGIFRRIFLQRRLIFLAQVTKDFFARAHGWLSSLRIDNHQCVRILVKLLQVVCPFDIGREIFKMMSPRCILLEINKVSLFQKKNIYQLFLSFLSNSSL